MIKMLKTKLADWLKKQSQKQKDCVKKAALVCCCVVVGGYCIGLVFGVVLFRLSDPAGITKPILSKDDGLKAGNRETTQAYITTLRRYMDSLGTTASGRAKRDSIMLLNPGIMDTVARLEEIIIHSK